MFLNYFQLELFISIHFFLELLISIYCPVDISPLNVLEIAMPQNVCNIYSFKFNYTYFITNHYLRFNKSL